eukprot:2986386-Rhodomonas_salina.1
MSWISTRDVIGQCIRVCTRPVIGQYQTQASPVPVRRQVVAYQCTLGQYQTCARSVPDIAYHRTPCHGQS